MRNIFTFTSSGILVCLLFIILYGAFRTSSLSLPYHQDEYKWALIAEGKIAPIGTIPHPPFGEHLYHVTGKLIGFDHLRVVPFTAGLIALLFLYLLTKELYSKKAAYFATFFYGISYWAVLGNTQIDIDGAFLPMWSLIFFYALLRTQSLEKISYRSLWPMLAGGFGLLAKLPFVLNFAAAFVWGAITPLAFRVREMRNACIVAVGAAIAFGALLLLYQTFFYPYVQLSLLVSWGLKNTVANTTGRDFVHLGYQLMRAAILAGPMLLLLALHLRSTTWNTAERRAHTLLYAWIGMQLLFYVVIGNFSHGPLERYLMALIAPVCILAGAYCNSAWQESSRTFSVVILMSIAGIVFYGALANLSPTTLPGYPKSQFVSNLLTGEWNFLFPITGGSGPSGFYIPVLFILGMWIIALLLGILILRRKATALALPLLIGVVVSYNVLFIREATGQGLYPTAAASTQAALQYLKATSPQATVITYNDHGAYELHQEGRYAGRFYAVPEYEENNLQKLKSKNYSGQVLVTDFPEINKHSGYWAYLSDCMQVYHRSISYIFQCK